MSYQYDGSILFERILKSNLPNKVAGNKILFVVQNPDDEAGEIWANNNKGMLVCYSKVADINSIQEEILGLQKQINDCLKTKLIPTGVTKISDLTQGIYCFYNGANTFTDYPTFLSEQGLVYGILEVEYAITGSFTGYVYKIKSIDILATKVVCVEGYRIGSMNLTWQQIATTTKTHFVCTANTGITISHQDCYIENGEFTLTLTLYLTNGTSFSQNIIALLPFTPKSIYVGSAMGRTDLTTSAWLKKVNCYCDTGKNIVVTTEETTVKQIMLTLKGGVA